ncbi:Mucin-4 [Geodia barretti]|uniref:Mucin-4 n=1 Tax=Geodia barretti TaxID=519541 RepID=A0AA35RWW6_GEOBA|nr:Mucin-4 [Geodia barretti]
MMPHVLLLTLAVSIYCGCSTPTRRDTTPVTYLTYFALDNPMELHPLTISDVDECSSPIIVLGGIPIGKIRAPNISVCENGVILTEPTHLRSSLCVCRGEFKTCEDPGESIYAIAPFWSNINNVFATHNASISYQTFERSNSSHTRIFERVLGWISREQNMAGSIQFFPTWMLVAQWKNVHPYTRPNEIDPRTNTFETILVTDGTQTYAVFTYNCSDLGWARASNTFVASDCSFIGNYIGGSFTNYLPETRAYGLQIDNRTANISRAASCSNPTTWNNFLFNLTPQRVVNITVREETVAVVIGGAITIQFYISTFVQQDFMIKLSFVPEIPYTTENSSHYFACNGLSEAVTIAGIEIITICSAGSVNVTVLNVTEGALGEYTVSVNVDETVGDTALSNLKLEDVVLSENLLLKTSDPLLLTSDDIASASADLRDLQAAALTNANVRQNYLKTIDNLMQADGSLIVQSQIENNSSSRILDTLQEFTLNVELPANMTNETYVFDTYGFVLFDINPKQFMKRNIGANLGPPEVVKNITIPVNISFSGDIEQEGLTVFVEVNDNMSNELRLSVVVYRQENLFQNNETGANITSAVVSISGKPSSGPSLTMGFLRLVEDDESESGNEVRKIKI